MIPTTGGAQFPRHRQPTAAPVAVPARSAAGACHQLPRHRQPVQVVASHPNVAARWAQSPADHPDERGLPCTVHTDHPRHPRSQRERQTLECPDSAAVGMRQILNLEPAHGSADSARGGVGIARVRAKADVDADFCLSIPRRRRGPTVGIAARNIDVVLAHLAPLPCVGFRASPSVAAESNRPLEC